MDCATQFSNCSDGVQNRASSPGYYQLRRVLRLRYRLTRGNLGSVALRNGQRQPHAKKTSFDRTAASSPYTSAESGNNEWSWLDQPHRVCFGSRG